MQKRFLWQKVGSLDIIQSQIRMRSTVTKIKQRLLVITGTSTIMAEVCTRLSSFLAPKAHSYGFGKKLAKKNAQNLKFEFLKKCCSQPMGDLQIKRWCFAPNQRTPNPNGVVFTTCFALILIFTGTPPEILLHYHHTRGILFYFKWVKNKVKTYKTTWSTPTQTINPAKRRKLHRIETPIKLSKRNYKKCLANVGTQKKKTRKRS